MTIQNHKINHNVPANTLPSLTIYKRIIRRVIDSLNHLSHVCGIRKRYILTRQHTIRARFSIPCIAILTFYSFFALSQVIPASHAHIANIALSTIQQSEAVQNMNQAMAEKMKNLSVVENKEKDEGNGTTHRTALFFKKPDNLLVPASYKVEEQHTYKPNTASKQKPKADPLTLTLKIGAGQTVSKELTKAGLPSSKAYAVVKAMSEYYDPRHVQAGQSFKVKFKEPSPMGPPREFKTLENMTMPVTAAKEIVITRTADNGFQAQEVEKETYIALSAQRATLKYSLYGSAAKAGIPDQVIAKMIKVFSWSVDFQRDIRSGDEIDILYEVIKTEDGDVIGYGDIKYARLVNGQNDMSLFRFTDKDGRMDYYDAEGHSSRKTLMKTPVDGARISSTYGMRHHPVLGYSKMHKGVDFAAPRGTPIYAAGDGVIEKAGRWGSFGNYVRIRHNSNLKTAYAHLQKFKSGIRPGVRVKQGDVIGYIGTTGRSTGPHLHYEVHLNGKQTNPNGVNVPVGEQLKLAELKKFKKEVQQYKNEFSSLTKSQSFANNLNN